MAYWVYILECADGTLYTGITSDLQRRVNEHNTGSRGAKYTRCRRPVTPVYSESCADKSAALKREREIKALPRSEKLKIIGRV